MTIVNCWFYDNPELTKGTLTVDRFDGGSDGSLSFPVSQTKQLINGQAFVTVFPGLYTFTALLSSGQVFWSQRVLVPDSTATIDLWDIATDKANRPSKTIYGQISQELANDSAFVGKVASLVQLSDLGKTVAFTDADLNASGVIAIVHNFGKAAESVRLIDSEGYEVLPDNFWDNGTNTTAIHLQSLRPLSGIWTAILGG